LFEFENAMKQSDFRKHPARFRLLCLLWIACSGLHAQKPEMVPVYEKQLQEATTDSARAMCLQFLSFNLAHSNPARSVQYGNEALRVAQNSGDAWLISQCQNGVGWAFFCSGNYSRARTLLDSSIQYMRATQDYFDLAPVCNNQGWICLKQGDNLGALQYFREGLNAAEASKDEGRIGFMNRSLGSFYNAQKEFDKSIPHIQQALKIFTGLRDTGQISDCLITLGNAYSGVKQYETAIDYYKKSLPLAQEAGDLLGEALIFENWGMALSQLGRFEEAFAKFGSARRLIEQLDEQIELAFLELTIGQTQLLKGDTAQAIAPLEKARRIGTQLQLDDVLTEALPALHTAYAAIGAPTKAYEALLAFQTLRDTTAAETGKLELQRLKTEFETERKEKDIQIKTLENTRLQSKFWLALAGFGLALMAGFAFWYRARQRRKTNAALELKNQEITAQKAEAERLRARAERSEAVKERFLAAMSHEIRTPMNAIVGLSQLLDAEHHPPTTAYNISIIRKSGEHLMTILNDVLDLAKIEAEKIELRPQPLALLPLLQFVRDTFAARAQEKGLELLLETDPNLPQNILADTVRFGQVLNNLVSNAIKFTDRGQVVISAKLLKTLHGSSHNAPITFSVRDTGMGIPTERQAAVFEEFVQADSGIGVTYGGTGLGLSIARSLVTQMGGTLHLDSKPGQGTEFFFSLDLPLASAKSLSVVMENEEKTFIPKLICKTPVHVLLVEDNVFNQTVAKQTIAAICPEINLEIVESGEDSLERIKAAHFDLILTDLQMPGMDGYETARQLRSAHFKGPIVALTASAVRTEAPKCIEAGMQEMLLKPIAPSEMAALLLRYIPEKLECPIPLALLHFAGGDHKAGRELLGIIRTELREHLIAIRQLHGIEDAKAIRKRIHKMRPQIIALGFDEHKALMDNLEHNTTADSDFWTNVRTLESIVDNILAKI
jgi:signal transduction histidine kinase/ActR/RegA family two-component response regulator